ncbi:MAG TPA: GvpL/GvpF family gas vesicle protein [Gemmatimonadaceae bacterium]
MKALCYVYGIVPDKPGLKNPPDGIDDAPVSLLRNVGLAALASELDPTTYTQETIEASSGDVNWISPRAQAHDRVLTWASDRAPVVPLVMFSSVFSDAEAVKKMLSERSAEFHAAIERVSRGREYALRVYRVDSELKAALPSLDPELGKLAAEAKAASPGQRYLIERKLDERVKEEVRSAGARIADEIKSELARVALETATSPIPKVSSDAPGVMVLNAAFLIDPDKLRSFQERLTAIVDKRKTSGFRFDFTGPWPAYHFARGDRA